jgi:hypothetical protein
MVVDLMREGVWRRGGGDLAHPAHVTLSFLARVLLRVRVYRQLMYSQNPDAISPSCLGRLSVRCDLRRVSVQNSIS